MLDDDGCGVDVNLLDNLEYQTDLMAGRDAHVFKYADRAQLYFNCQIRILVKEPNQNCPLPDCAPPPATLGKKRRRRSVNSYQGLSLDVSSNDLQILDLNIDARNRSHSLGDSQPQLHFDSQVEATSTRRLFFFPMTVCNAPQYVEVLLTE